MKLVIFFILGLVAFSIAKTTSHPRGCIYIEGRCMYDCPVGTHSYTTGCSPKTNEPTCDEPNPVPDDYDICDFSACYCDAPTVRDTVSNKCVKPEDCPKKKPEND